MKVVAALADSASIQQFEFKQDVDTSKQQAASLTSTELVPGPAALPKKRHAVTHLIVLPDGRVAAARKDGDVVIGEDVVGHLEADIVGLALGENESVVAFSSNGSGIAVCGDKTFRFTLRDGLSVVVQNPRKLSQFASAGAAALPNVFDLKLDAAGEAASVDVVWEGAQPPNDYLDLPERNLVSGLAFVDSEQLVSVTSHGRMRVYDLKSGEGQPEEMAQVSKDGIKSVAADMSFPNTVVVGDSRSTVSRWSLNPVKLMGHYKGVVGSTRSISLRGKYMAVGGLDRYVRVYDVVKRQPAGRVYVGNEIWALSLERTDDEEDKEELDGLWSELDPKSKRRKTGTEDGPGSSRGPTKTNAARAKGEDASAPHHADDASGEDTFSGFDD